MEGIKNLSPAVTKAETDHNFLRLERGNTQKNTTELSTEIKELEKRITDELDDLNQNLKSLAKDLHFMLHEDANAFYVQVVNRQSEQIIKELPPKEFLDLIANLRKMVGVFLDEVV